MITAGIQHSLEVCRNFFLRATTHCLFRNASIPKKSPKILLEKCHNLYKKAIIIRHQIEGYLESGNKVGGNLVNFLNKLKMCQFVWNIKKGDTKKLKEDYEVKGSVDKI